MMKICRNFSKIQVDLDLEEAPTPLDIPLVESTLYFEALKGGGPRANAPLAFQGKTVLYWTDFL